MPYHYSYDRRSDLSPPLGDPGGPCQVVRRIERSVRNPRERDHLKDEVQEGKSLTNPEAAEIYQIDAESGAGIANRIIITSHTQYRMDLRSIRVRDVQEAVRSFSAQMEAWKRIGSKAYDAFVDHLTLGEKITWKDPRTKLTIVFTQESRGTLRLITTYWKGREDPPPPIHGECSKRTNGFNLSSEKLRNGVGIYHGPALIIPPTG